jgi:hypothetical protein
MQSANLIAEGLAGISSSSVDINLNGDGIFEGVGVLFVSVLPLSDLRELQTSVDHVAIVWSAPPLDIFRTQVREERR